MHDATIVILFSQCVGLVHFELSSVLLANVVPHDTDVAISIRSCVFVFVPQCVHHFV